MSWSSAISAAALALLVAACGFQPLYKKSADDPGVTADLAEVKVMNVEAEESKYDRLSQQMRGLLKERINPRGSPRSPRYRLESQMFVSIARTGIQITEEATRARLTVTSNFSLIDSASGQPLFTGSEQSVNSYNVADSKFATLRAEQDAARRAVR
ncbi:MAG: LPS assembly lipoprotein LptE [Pseudomonadota bacterium]